MEQPITDRQVVLIEVPEDTDAEDLVTGVKPVDALELRLEPVPRGYGITTPVVFDLDDTWTVQNVVLRPVEDE